MTLVPTTRATRATMTIAVVEGATTILPPGGATMTGMEEVTVEVTKTGREDMTAVAGETTRRGTTIGATRRCLHSTPSGDCLWMNCVSQEVHAT